MKKCSKCGVIKKPELFQKNLNQCKECRNKKIREWQDKNSDRFKRKKKEWASKNPEKIKEYAQKHNKGYYEKNAKRSAEYYKDYNREIRIANILKMEDSAKEQYEKIFVKSKEDIGKRVGCRENTRALVRRGELIKHPCEVCGELKVEAHHSDYNDPCNINWLCKKHHVELHVLERERNL